MYAKIRIKKSAPKKYHFEIFIHGLLSWNESYYPETTRKKAEKAAIEFLASLKNVRYEVVN